MAARGGHWSKGSGGGSSFTSASGDGAGLVRSAAGTLRAQPSAGEVDFKVRGYKAKGARLSARIASGRLSPAAKRKANRDLNAVLDTIIGLERQRAALIGAA